jgi:hypothetical protein
MLPSTWQMSLLLSIGLHSGADGVKFWVWLGGLWTTWQCKREGFLQKIKEEEGEGCNVYGSLEVNKVAGNFHFAPGKSFQQSNMHVHDLLAFGKDSFNLSHTIKEISFGAHFPGVVNPLDRVERIQETPHGIYQYFIKVVPTVYTDIRGRRIVSNQFSVTDHFKEKEPGKAQSLPGVFFFYDLSPIKVRVHGFILLNACLLAAFSCRLYWPLLTFVAF